MQKRVHHDDLASEAEALLARLARGERATVVALSGDLGAGKTTFTQHVARALGVEEVVVSPTFVIQKVYALPREIPRLRDSLRSNNVLGAESRAAGQSFDRLVHVDAYRLEGAHELKKLGWAELLADPGNLILIEWPERVSEALPPGTLYVTLDTLDEFVRSFSYEIN